MAPRVAPPTSASPPIASPAWAVPKKPKPSPSPSIPEEQEAPYLTHLVRHRGRVTLIPPDNSGRTRQAFAGSSSSSLSLPLSTMTTTTSSGGELDGEGDEEGEATPGGKKKKKDKIVKKKKAKKKGVDPAILDAVVNVGRGDTPPAVGSSVAAAPSAPLMVVGTSQQSLEEVPAPTRPRPRRRRVNAATTTAPPPSTSALIESEPSYFPPSAVYDSHADWIPPVPSSPPPAYPPRTPSPGPTSSVPVEPETFHTPPPSRSPTLTPTFSPLPPPAEELEIDAALVQAWEEDRAAGLPLDVRIARDLERRGVASLSNVSDPEPELIASVSDPLPIVGEDARDEIEEAEAVQDLPRVARALSVYAGRKFAEAAERRRERERVRKETREREGTMELHEEQEEDEHASAGAVVEPEAPTVQSPGAVGDAPISAPPLQQAREPQVEEDAMDEGEREDSEVSEEEEDDEETPSRPVDPEASRRFFAEAAERRIALERARAQRQLEGQQSPDLSQPVSTRTAGPPTSRFSDASIALASEPAHDTPEGARERALVSRFSDASVMASTAPIRPTIPTPVSRFSDASVSSTIHTVADSPSLSRPPSTTTTAETLAAPQLSASHESPSPPAFPQRWLPSAPIPPPIPPSRIIPVPVGTSSSATSSTVSPDPGTAKQPPLPPSLRPAGGRPTLPPVTSSTFSVSRPPPASASPHPPPLFPRPHERAPPQSWQDQWQPLEPEVRAPLVASFTNSPVLQPPPPQPPPPPPQSRRRPPPPPPSRLPRPPTFPTLQSGASSSWMNPGPHRPFTASTSTSTLPTLPSSSSLQERASRPLPVPPEPTDRVDALTAFRRDGFLPAQPLRPLSFGGGMTASSSSGSIPQESEGSTEGVQGEGAVRLPSPSWDRMAGPSTATDLRSEEADSSTLAAESVPPAAEEEQTAGREGDDEDFVYTDLDVLLARLEVSNASNYEDLLAINDLLGPVVSTSSTQDEIDTLPFAPVVLDRRRVDKQGKVKLKLSVVGVRCVDCQICLARFKVGEMAVVLEKCLHVFHAKCVSSWLRRSRLCPLCREPVFQPLPIVDI